jgi:type I restriction enzyme, S subunit
VAVPESAGKSTSWTIQAILETGERGGRAAEGACREISMNAAYNNSVWLGEVPPDWRRTCIKRVADFSPSYSGGKPEEDEICTVVPMDAVSEFGAVRVESQEVFSDVTPGLTLFENGDVLFAKITPCMENGKGAQVSNLPTRYAFGSTEFHVMRPSHEIDGKFLYFATFNPFFRAWAEKNMQGAAGQQRVTTRFLKYSTLPLPPLAEQKRIAAYLDASCAAIDRAVETKRKQLETLDALRKSIITPSVLTGLGEDKPLMETGNAWLPRIPKGWKLVALKRVSNIQTGITLGKTYEPPLIERPYLRAANVQDGYLTLEKITTIEIPEQLAARYELQVGDVLMTEGGDLDKLGRGFPWSGEIPGCLHQNHVFAIRTNRRHLLSRFLAYVTASRYGRDYFEATGKRTTNLASTNSTKVGLFPIPLPPLAEQKAIVEHIDRNLEKARRIEDALNAQITTLTAYRKSLIHECVTGKRRISDADVTKVEAHV